MYVMLTKFLDYVCNIKDEKNVIIKVDIISLLSRLTQYNQKNKNKNKIKMLFFRLYYYHYCYLF